MHDELIRLADEYWDGLMAAYPSSATLVGDHRFDDRIEDYSVEAEDRLRADWVALAGRVDALDPAALSHRFLPMHRGSIRGAGRASA